MYPFFEPFPWLHIYTFWLSLTICFFLFLWMVKRLSHRFGVNDSFFFNKILWYFLSVFIFSRLFYIIGHWGDLKYINNPVEFFLMNDYNFSLIWAFFWFFLILYWSVISNGLRSAKYVDVSILSFLFASVMWYVGAFLWGQVYGRETNFWIEILYSNPFSKVPYEVPIFPLALVYALVFFVLFSVLYMLAMFISVRWVIGYIWLIMIGGVFLTLENFSGKSDYFEPIFFINFNQVWALAFILIGIYGLYRIYKTPRTTEVIH